MTDKKVDSLHTVEIVAVKGEVSKVAVAKAVASTSKNLTFEQTRLRMESLPWTLTRNVTRETAATLMKVLEPAGAVLRIEPPLEGPVAGVHRPWRAEPFKGHSVAATQISLDSRRATAPAAPGAPLDDLRSSASTGSKIEPPWLASVLRCSLRIWRTGFWKLVGIIMPWLLISRILEAIGATLSVPFSLTTMTTPSHWTTWFQVTAVALLSGLAVAACVPFIGAMVQAVSSVYLNQKVDILSSYRSSLRRAPALFRTSLLFLAAVALLMLILAVLSHFSVTGIRSATGGTGPYLPIRFFVLLMLTAIAIYVIPKFIMFDKVVILENKSGIQALGRSWSLLSGKADSDWPARFWLRNVIVLLMIVLVYAAIRLLFSLFAIAIKVVVPEPAMTGAMLSYITGGAAEMLSMLFGGVVAVVFYFDTCNRQKKLGFVSTT